MAKYDEMICYQKNVCISILNSTSIVSKDTHLHQMSDCDEFIIYSWVLEQK